MMNASLLVAVALAAVTPVTPAVAPAATVAPPLTRPQWNARAVERNVPLFWIADTNNNNIVDADELAVLWHPSNAQRSSFVGKDGKLTKKFEAAQAALLTNIDDGKRTPAEQARRALVREELSQGRTTLVLTDLRTGTDEDRAIVKNLLQAAQAIERLYARQSGTFGLDNKIAADDAASRMMFFRNQGPFCEAPKTEKNPQCTAVDGAVKKSGIYPTALQGEGFCEALEKRADAAALLDHFNIVTTKQRSGTMDPATSKLEAVPYTKAYVADMAAAAKSLKAAAAAIRDPKEDAFKKYLLAAAQAFADNNWFAADEAWAAMSADNSKWFLRIGPDEVYHEPCAHKAGFHMSFARINQASKELQQKLEPVKKQMEASLAKLAGAPYVARDVAFDLPEFIDVVLNAGDSRSALGATIGQSLPNWGPVSEKGGRTVAMTNLYTDPDSEAALIGQTQTLFCKDTSQKFDVAARHANLSTVLHEAAHNLGPSHDYKVNGKTDDEVFGGPLASMMEELKAQTSALYFSEWLVDQKVLTAKDAQAAHLRDVAWAFGHIAQGMYTGDNKPKAYSQLAAVQMGTLWKSGVLVWRAKEMAANGADMGCFSVDLTKWRASVDGLAGTVLRIKGSGDKAQALTLKANFVDDTTEWSKLRSVVAERWLRSPKASFVYAVVE
jgi:hypothetical protein